MQDMRANIASQAETGDYILLLTPPPLLGYRSHSTVQEHTVANSPFLRKKKRAFQK